MAHDVSPAPKKHALVLPGAGYPAMAPLLHWCTAMLRQAGWTVSAATWPDRRTADADPLDMVESVVAHEAATDWPDLVVAKSLGTFAAGWAVRQQVPGVWLTPLATDPRVLAALRESGATSLVVAGTGDPYWVRGALRGTAVGTLEVDGADHSLETSDWRASLRIHERVYAAVHEHLIARALIHPPC